MNETIADALDDHPNVGSRFDDWLDKKLADAEFAGLYIAEALRRDADQSAIEHQDYARRAILTVARVHRVDLSAPADGVLDNVTVTSRDNHPGQGGPS